MSLVAILTILEEEEFVPTTENSREDQLTSQEEQFTSQVFITQWRRRMFGIYIFGTYEMFGNNFIFETFVPYLYMQLA